MSPRTAVRVGAKPLVAQSGPWTGVHDSPEQDADTSGLLYDARDCWIPDPSVPSSVFQRPPMNKNANQLGAGSTRMGQGVLLVTGLDGTDYRFLACGGKLYRWAGDSSAPVDVSPAGITISTTARVYMAAFAGTLIVNDGVNQPWQGTNLGGSPITGTVINYDSVPHTWTAFGMPVVYSAKVFFIVSALNGVAARSTILWSEENNALVGYTQANYDNSWQLSQTDTNPLYRLIGTNDALFYWREISIGFISGKVFTDFRTSATHDSVSNEVGTLFPAGFVQMDTTTFFLDRNGYPYLLNYGNAYTRPTVTPIWRQMRKRLVTYVSGGLQVVPAVACASYVPELKLLAVYGIEVLNTGIQPQVSSLNVFHAETGKWLGHWVPNGGTNFVDAMGMLKNSTGAPILALLGSTGSSSTYTAGQQGALWTLNLLDLVTPLSSNETAFSPVISTHRVLDDARTEKQFDLVTVELVDSPDGGQFGLICQTSRNGYFDIAALLATANSTGSQDYDAYISGGSVRWGISRKGRWARVSVQFPAMNVNFLPAVTSVRVEAFPDGANPKIP